jgi:hypothetical protein
MGYFILVVFAVLFFGIIAYALRQKRSVRAKLKGPFSFAVEFEADRGEADRSS